MSVSSIASAGGAADSLLSAFLQNSLKAALGSQNTISLFVPQDLTDPVTKLSPRDLVALLRNVRSSLLSLSDSAARLDLASPTSAFFAGAVSSSNSAVVTGTIVPGISQDTTPVKSSYSFTISALAVGQANAGTKLTSTSISSFGNGTNTFSVTQNGTTTNVSFTVAGGDRNIDVLNNMAIAINNNTTLGITASVNTDPVANTSQIIIQSKSQGTAQAFTLANVTKTPITDSGTGSATTAAANASYTLNGVALTSSSNEFFLGTNANLRVDFNSTSSTPVVLTVGPDVNQISGAVATLVNDFNTAKGFFDSNSAIYPGAAAQLNSVVSQDSSQLRNIGVNVNTDGTLSVDSAKLSVAITQYASQVQAAIGDVGGLAKELHAIADKQLSIPTVAQNPLPPYQSGISPRVLVGTFASRLNQTQLKGLLVSALI